MQDNLAPSTSTSCGSRILAGLWLTLLSTLAALPVEAQADRLAKAIGHYHAAEYGQAVELLQQAIADTPSSEAYHWLGKSFGNLAERAGTFRALRLAHMTRQALEKAVELDEYNRTAVRDLMKFYQEAPAMVGGSQEQAARLRERLSAMERNSRQEETDRNGVRNDS